MTVKTGEALEDWQKPNLIIKYFSKKYNIMIDDPICCCLYYIECEDLYTVDIIDGKCIVRDSRSRDDLQAKEIIELKYYCMFTAKYCACKEMEFKRV